MRDEPGLQSQMRQRGATPCRADASGSGRAVSLYRRLALLAPEAVMISLKVAVIAVTMLLLASLVALAKGNYWLHGRINIVFFVLTLSALAGLEVIARVLEPDLFEEFIASRQAESQ